MAGLSLHERLVKGSLNDGKEKRFFRKRPKSLVAICTA
jgi:hypothetical protein